MPSRRLRTYGDPVLKKKARPVASAEIDALSTLIADMFDTMYENEGVGLAAEQVGETLSLFVINADWNKEKEKQGLEEVFINPCITKVYGEFCESEEGCLSVPDIRETVKRKETLDIEYIDRHGKKKVETGVTGHRARIIQHENDHLNGILFVERLAPTKKIFLRNELKQLAEERDDD